MPPGLKLGLVIENDPGAAPSANSPYPDAFNSSMKTDESGVIIGTEGGKKYRFSKTGMQVEGREDIRLTESDLNPIKVIGYGASATVSKAFYPRINRFVALKRISHVEKQNRSAMLKDLHTLDELFQKDCPGLVSFLGAFMSSEQDISLALEYMDGGSLSGLCMRCAERGQEAGRIPEPILGKITHDTLQGLLFLASRHTVHRDVKPANILVSTNGQAKLSDFGIAKSNDNTVAQCHTYAGTVTYMSPERINSKPYDSRADVWSLGLTVLECAEGRYPYDASVGPLQLMIHICEDSVPVPKSTSEGGEYSPEFVDFIRVCMEKDPQKRASVQSLAEHPWPRAHRDRAPELSRFVARHSNTDEKVSDTAWLMVNRFYMFMDAGSRGAEKAAALFTDTATIRYRGSDGAGEPAAERLRAMVADDKARGGAVRKLRDVQTHRLVSSDKSSRAALIMAKTTGTIAYKGEGQAPVHFHEVFVIDTSGASKERGKGYYGCFFSSYMFVVDPMGAWKS